MQLSALFTHGPGVPGPDGEVEITGLTSDSRKVEPGFLFAALKGLETDGARFVANAIENGAIAVLGAPDVVKKVPKNVTFVASDRARHDFALAAARFFGVQPEIAVGITGTNGKTSVAAFLRQIWQALGHGAASIGTVGVVSSTGSFDLQHTTPDPVELHRILRDIAADPIDHVAIEVSSHGLQQCRADGIRFAAAAFTNISRDHLDYHADFQHYFDAKMKLFRELIHPGACAVINADCDEAETVREICAEREIRTLMVGEKGEDLRLERFERDGMIYTVRVSYGGRDYDFILPLTGEFQISNALVAAGLAIATGSSPEFVFRAMERLKGARGRMDHVIYTDSGAPIFVDYSHTPDALDNALRALRPFVEGRLIVIFGAGGDRDKGKRPEMGKVAADLADVAIVTDDNPRTEDPAKIRKAILKACPGATEIGDRAEAIAHGVAMLATGDVLLIAGKGHEAYQEIGTKRHSFSDHDVALKAVAAMPDGSGND